MPDYADTLAQLVQARDSARELLTELRGTIKDSRAAKKEALDFLNQTVETVVLVAVNNAISHQIETLERRFAEDGEKVARRIATGGQQVIDELKAKEKFILETATTLRETITMLNESFTGIRERLETLEKAHLLMHEQYHTLSGIVKLDEERIDNVWKAVAAIEAILSGLRERVNYLMVQLGEE